MQSPEISTEPIEIEDDSDNDEEDGEAEPAASSVPAESEEASEVMTDLEMVAYLGSLLNINIVVDEAEDLGNEGPGPLFDPGQPFQAQFAAYSDWICSSEQNRQTVLSHWKTHPLRIAGVHLPPPIRWLGPHSQNCLPVRSLRQGNCLPIRSLRQVMFDGLRPIMMISMTDGGLHLTPLKQ